MEKNAVHKWIKCEISKESLPVAGSDGSSVYAYIVCTPGESPYSVINGRKNIEQWKAMQN